MHFVSFRTPSGVASWGALDDGRIHDLGPSGAGVSASLREAIANEALDAIMIDPAGGPTIPVSDVELLPVIPDPGKILCIGVNYRSHREETGKSAAAAPTVFVRFADSLLGHDQPAIRPASTEQFDYEGELAIVIGRPAHRVPVEDAWSVVAGAAAFNDLTARDWQRATSQWTPGKNFPKTGAFGPAFVPLAEIGDIEALHLETRVNGETLQSADLADLIFPIPELIAHVTGFTPLAPGDVIVTGTPGGVGVFRDPQRLLVDGDVVEVEITGLGVLRNVVRQE